MRTKGAVGLNVRQPRLLPSPYLSNHLILQIRPLHTVRHHRQELGEVDLTAAVRVDLVAVGWVCTT